MRDIRLKRSYLALQCLKPNCLHINYQKLSDCTKQFIAAKINSVMSKQSRTQSYTVKDLYFTNGCRSDLKRSLCVVIKHSDSQATEAMYFATK